MMAWGKVVGVWLAIVVLVGCAAPAPRGDVGSGTSTSAPVAGAEPRASGPKRITLALKDDLPGLSDKVRQGPGAGIGIAEELLHAGLGVIDATGTIQPQLAEQVPSLENGLWKVNADGTMETTWKIRPGVKWHDGTPFTAADLVFTATFERDPQVPYAGRNSGWSAVQSVTAADPQTVVVTWRRPHIEADQLFGRRFGMPVAQHKVEAAYNENPATVIQHPYWTNEFVGTGPFRLKEYVQGERVVVTANPDFVLGRPKLDEIEIRPITDGNALVANVLSGAVDLYVANGLSLEQGIEVRNQWRDGKMEAGPNQWLTIHPQLLNPTPGVVSNLQFRRALLHGIDRQQLVESLQFGLTSVAHSYLQPNQPQYRDLEARLPRYDFDVRRAEQMLADLGYTKGPDGMLRDATGQRLQVELRTTAQVDMQATAMATVADSWQRLGVGSEQVLIPFQRLRDASYRATFPSFEVLNGPPNGEEGLAGLHSSRTRLPENNFLGSNYSRYMNPEFDALLDRYFTTIPRQDRTQALGGVINHIAENLVTMGLIHVARPVLLANRVTGPAAVKSTLATEAWNAPTWDLAR